MKLECLQLSPATAHGPRSGGSLQTQEVATCKESMKLPEVDPPTMCGSAPGRKRVDSLPCLHIQQPHALLDRPTAADRDEGTTGKSKKGYLCNQSRSVCDILTLVIHDSKQTDSNGIVNKEWILAIMPGSENKHQQSDGKNKVTLSGMCVFKEDTRCLSAIFFVLITTQRKSKCRELVKLRVIFCEVIVVCTKSLKCTVFGKDVCCSVVRSLIQIFCRIPVEMEFCDVVECLISATYLQEFVIIEI